MKNLSKQPVFWLCLILLIPLWALALPGLPFTHDGQDHVARIASFYASLSEGNIIPRWAANLNWGYGHPILMFLYPMSSYAASLFHFIGFSFVDSTKLVFAVSFIVSGVCMYIWLASAYSRRVGVIGALLYTFAPYRFVDMYVRGAIGEHVAFIFPPLILFFIFKLHRISRFRDSAGFICGASCSVAGLLLAHNAIAIMFLPVIALYALYLFFGSENKRVFPAWCIVSGLLGFGLASFFWLPAFFEGKYTLRDIVTAGEALTRFVPWRMFFFTPWSYGGGDQLSKFLGFGQWFGVILAAWILLRQKNMSNRLLLISSLCLLFLSIFMMTPASAKIWSEVTLLQKFQFPWRFLSVVVFLAAIIGAISSDFVLKNTYFYIGFCVLIVSATAGMWRPAGYVNKPEAYYKGIYYSTTDTGESSPIWSVRFMEHTPKAISEVISGDAKIQQGKRTSVNHNYIIEVNTPARILENTLYFPGWSIYVDGKKTDIQFQDPEFRGLMTYKLTEGTHNINIRFEETKLRYISNMISAGSLMIMIVLLLIPVWKKRM